MAVRNLKRTSAALIASITWAGGSWAPAQFDNRLLPSSESTVIVALRPQAPANQAPTIQAPEIPSNGGVKDGTGKDDEVKTAIGGGTPPTSETGRLNPIVMESVRAPIGAADISVADIGTKIVPEDQAAKQAVATLPLPGGLDRAFEGLTYRWQAANICHLPLYFEEPTLERHGQQRCPTCVQPVVSGGKF
ncbi:MAG: hypothetical protein IT423_11935, partial [Pirellulaceae bacterium]|nr:hypothetical protein [Pirellulaceae bacterium]